MAAASTYQFGQFELDLRSYELKRDDQPLRLEKIPMELLIYLVEHHGELIASERSHARRAGGGPSHVVTGYQRPTVLLRRESWKVNPNRIYRWLTPWKSAAWFTTRR